MCAQAAARAAVNIGAGAAPRRGPSKCSWLAGRMHKSGWEAPTYPSFDFRQSAEKSLVLSLKRASARTLRARRSGTGPGRWVDLASLKASRPRMYARGRAGRPRSRHFTAKRWSKTKLALHTKKGPFLYKISQYIILFISPCDITRYHVAFLTYIHVSSH